MRSITVKVATSEQRALANAGGGLIARVAAASARDGVEIVELTLATTRGRLRTLGESITNAVEGVLKMPNVRESVEKLTAKGYVAGRNTSEMIDLLEDDLVVSK